MKIGVYNGEAFPICEIHDYGFNEINIDEDTLARWKIAFEQFTAVQQEIINELEKQGLGHVNWDECAWDGWKL